MIAVGWYGNKNGVWKNKWDVFKDKEEALVCNVDMMEEIYINMKIIVVLKNEKVQRIYIMFRLMCCVELDKKSYLPTPLLRQDMTQGQFLSGV